VAKAASFSISANAPGKETGQGGKGKGKSGGKY
jgi:hypothetical protein